MEVQRLRTRVVVADQEQGPIENSSTGHLPKAIEEDARCLCPRRRCEQRGLNLFSAAPLGSSRVGEWFYDWCHDEIHSTLGVGVVGPRPLADEVPSIAIRPISHS